VGTPLRNGGGNFSEASVSQSTRFQSPDVHKKSHFVNIDLPKGLLEKLQQRDGTVLLKLRGNSFTLCLPYSQPILGVLRKGHMQDDVR